MANSILEILFPVFMNDSNAYRNTGNPFAYYTNSDTALKILRSQSIWMRKPSMMNDYSEIDHGIKCLAEAYNSAEGQGFKNVLNRIHPGIIQDVDNVFTHTVNTIKTDTFISCFTKHFSDREDNIGRLSMWRAYGKNNGIALIFKPQIFFNNYTMEQTGIINSPVAYSNSTEIKQSLNVIAANINQNIELIHSYTREQMQNWIISVYSMAVMCNKHSGFWEEQEWRALTYPPFTNGSPFISQSVELINGTPQKVKSFNFKQVPGIPDLTLHDLLQKIIIGPCAHPEVTKEALVEELARLNFQNPAELVHISHIPLRQS